MVGDADVDTGASEDNATRRVTVLTSLAQSYRLRLVKPLALAMGIQEAFLFWGLGTGVCFFV